MQLSSDCNDRLKPLLIILCFGNVELHLKSRMRHGNKPFCLIANLADRKTS
jgi:hypothetical protein